MSDADRYLADAMAFRREQLIIDAKGTRLGDVIEPWQERKIYRPLDERQDDGRLRYRLAYLELPRGHAKTTMIAGEAVTQLVLGGADRRLHIAAGDKDQARELFDAAVGFIRRNPRLSPAFDVTRDRVVNRRSGSTLRVHSSDAPTAHGLIVDWFAIDEFWNQTDRDLWDAFYTAIVKRPDWRGIVITTAGYDKETICWQVREQALRRDDFYAFIADGQLASWITDEEIERLRDTLPPAVFQRLVENKWVEGSGSFIDREVLKRCFDPRLTYAPHGYAGQRYYLAVDLGIKKDRTAGALIHAENGYIVLDDLRLWEGSRGAPVQIADVEAWMAGIIRRFPVARILMDPWQAQPTIQKFRGRIEEFNFTSQSVSRLSNNLYHLLQSATLRMPPDPDLERELAELQAVQTPYGWRIDHARNKHDDRAMAIGMAALAAMRDTPQRRGRMRRARMGSGQSGKSLALVGGRVLYLDENGVLSARPMNSLGKKGGDWI